MRGSSPRMTSEFVGLSDSIFKQQKNSRGADCARVVLGRPRKTEGAGKTGCALHPRSRVQTRNKENAHEHTGSAETLRPSLRNGFNGLLRALPGEPGLFATIISGKFRQLDTSIGVSG